MYCPNIENHSTCTCRFQGRKYFELKCVHVSIEQIRTFLSTIHVDFSSIHIEPNDSIIPIDFLVNHRAVEIKLCGNDSNPQQFQPEIHPEAFRSSRNFTETFYIVSFNLSNVNFSFLTNFHRLKVLGIDNSFDLNLATFPTLDSLIELWIIYCQELSGWSNFPTLSNGISILSLEGNKLNDEEADRILQWILLGPSRYTLTGLINSYNA